MIRAKIYARLIIKGKMTISDVSQKYPAYLDDVKQALIEMGHPELTEQEKVYDQPKHADCAGGASGFNDNMYEFLAMRIHEGYLTRDAIKAKSFFGKVKDAYAKKYPDEKLDK